MLPLQEHNMDNSSLVIVRPSLLKNYGVLFINIFIKMAVLSNMDNSK